MPFGVLGALRNFDWALENMGLKREVGEFG